MSAAGSVIITLAMLEMMLWHLDPLGVMDSRYWTEFSFLHRSPHPTGYRLDSGTYDVHGHTVIIDEQGNRSVPDRDEASCKIAFIGDSFTFGWGVSDEYGFAYRIAEARPDVQFINTGKPGYNASNLQRAFEYWPVDGYVHLGLENDLIHQEAKPTRAQMPFVEHIAIRGYTRHIWLQMDAQQKGKTDPTPSQVDQYSSLLDTMQTVPVVFAMVSRNGFAYEIASEEWDDEIVIMPRITGLSVADGHPNETDHAHYADTLLPHIDRLSQNVCVEQ